MKRFLNFVKAKKILSVWNENNNNKKGTRNGNGKKNARVSQSVRSVFLLTRGIDIEIHNS